jgi:UDP-glucose 4-epimerase
MKVLVTGSGGRVGQAIVARLRNTGDDGITVTTLDRQPQSQATWIGDIGDSALLESAMKGIDAVIHTAALHAPHVGKADDSEFERININATKTLIDVAVHAGVQRIIYTSTTALYGHTNAEKGRAAWLTEKSVARPKTIYHRTKLAAEDLLANAAAQHGLLVRSLRMSRCFPELAAHMAAYRLHRGVDARDVAHAHALALMHTQAHAGSNFDSFIISGSTPFLIEDAEALFFDAAAVLQRRAPALVAAFAQRSWALPTSIDRVYDAGKAWREMGWKTQFGFEEVLAQADARSAEVLQ